MATFNDSHVLAEYLLRESLDRLGAAAPNVNYFTLRSVGGASILLGFDAIAAECESILQTIPDASFVAGVISNFPLPKKAPPALHKIATIDQLNSDHPPLTDESIVKYIHDCGNSQTHLKFAADRKYSDAFAACKSELDTEETAATQAVLGDIDSALDAASCVVQPDFRANSVRFICTIELFRRERWSEAQKLFDLIYPSQVGPDAAAQMALGANHRLPWLGYPFPDW